MAGEELESSGLFVGGVLCVCERGAWAYEGGVLAGYYDERYVVLSALRSKQDLGRHRFLNFVSPANEDECRYGNIS